MNKNEGRQLQRRRSEKMLRACATKQQSGRCGGSAEKAVEAGKCGTGGAGGEAERRKQVERGEGEGYKGEGWWEKVEETCRG